MSRIIFIVPTMKGDSISEGMREIQSPNLSKFGSAIYANGIVPLPGAHCPILGKMIDAYKLAIKVFHDSKDGILPEDFIIWTHHDVMIDDANVMNEYISFLVERGYAVSGPSENDGVGRSNYNGTFYINSHFLAMNAIKTSRWHEVDSWVENGWISNGKEFILRGCEYYWKVCHDNMGSIYYLDSRPREPRIGKATELLFKGKPFASHLWHSSGSISRPGIKTYEGITLSQISEWCQEWFDVYGSSSRSDRQVDPNPLRVLGVSE